MSATTEKSPSTVEGQLSTALLSSNNEEVTRQHVQIAPSAGSGVSERHMNIIENQLLSLEDQFWRTPRRSNSAKEQGPPPNKFECDPQQSLTSTLQSVVLESAEDTALLSDSGQQAEMSKSTPIKRAVKVSVTGVNTVVLDDDPGGGMSRLVASPSSNLSRIKRFEQFLKSLVGKRSSAGDSHQPEVEAVMTPPTTEQEFESPPLKARSNVAITTSSIKDHDMRSTPKQSPTVDLRRPSYGSMSSLNTAVQQKFLNMLPSSASALSLSNTVRHLSTNNLATIPEMKPACTTRRNKVALHQDVPRRLKTVSCSNFEQINTVVGWDTMAGPDTKTRSVQAECALTNGMRQPMQSVQLKGSKSTNHLQSVAMANGTNGSLVRPLNRLRNSLLEGTLSQVNMLQEPPPHCSRCSSILSLAGSTTSKVRCSDSSVTEASSSNRSNQGESGPVIPSCQNVVVVRTRDDHIVQSCKLCLGDVSPLQLTEFSHCGCTFCSDVSARLIVIPNQHAVD